MVTCMAYSIVAACFILQLRRIGNMFSVLTEIQSKSQSELSGKLLYYLVKDTYFQSVQNFDIKMFINF